MSADIALITSIPPRQPRSWPGRDPQYYQNLCIQSWIACGFRVMSLNPVEEIPLLAPRHPEVEFVPAPRDASALAGRKLPLITDKLVLAAQAPEPVAGIVNSDILFDPGGQWAQLKSIAGTRTIVAGQRYDTKVLHGGALHQFIAGFDYFFFDKSAAAELAEDSAPFAIGLPWWDYWLPLSLALKDWHVQFLERPAGIHLSHNQGGVWEARSPVWRELAWALVDIVARQTSRRAREVPPNLRYLAAYCSELAAAPSRDETQDERLIHLANACIPVIWANPTRLPATPPPPATPQDLAESFAAFEIRVQGGAALHEAIKCEQKGDLHTAETHYRNALARLPNDTGVLANFGSCLFRLGRIPEATRYLERAVDLAPSSIEIANRLAAALHMAGRSDEAVAAAERALCADPFSGPSYFTYALVLGTKGRAGEALQRLEAVLAEHPEFPDGEEWRGRVRGVVSAPPRG